MLRRVAFGLAPILFVIACSSSSDDPAGWNSDDGMGMAHERNVEPWTKKPL